MSRNYSISFNGVTVSAQQDLFELVAGAARPLRIRGLFLTQATEVGDASEQMLSIVIKSGQTTSGSGGSAPTAVALCASDSAAGLTAETNNTVKASGGTIVTHHAENWNVRMPYQLILPDAMQVELAGGRRLTVELATTPAGSIIMSGTLYVEELG